MKTFTLTGATALSPTVLRAGLLDPSTWRGQDATVEPQGDRGLTVAFPLTADAVPEAMTRFIPPQASLRMDVQADAEAPAGSPQTAHLTVTVPGAPVEVRVAFTAAPTAPADGAARSTDGAARSTEDPEDSDAAEGAGSTVTIHAEIESSVPIFGPMVESAIEPIVRAQMREKFDKLVDLR